MNTIEVMKQALEALEESIDLVQNEFDTNWRHGIPTRQAQLDYEAKMLKQHNKSINNLHTAITEMERVEPVTFLCDGTRYKVSRDAYHGTGCQILGLPDELQGEWVALVEATDNCHIRLTHPQDRDAWRDAVTDELVICGIYNESHDHNPRKALHDAILWNVQVALDPLVSSNAVELMERGRDSIIEECAAMCELGEGQSEYARYYITQIRALKGKK